MKEFELIKLLSGMLGRSPSQLNRPFESDAEFVRLGEHIYGITVDEHNPTEDRFSSFDPEVLGWNLVVCTVSDLLAAGVTPAFYLHAMALPRKAEGEFFEGLFRGMTAALSAEGCALLGGDTSFADTWRYVGVALGPSTRPILRSGAQPGDQLFSTGRFGSGNRQALLSVLLEQQRIVDDTEHRKLATVRFACRRAEAERAWSLVHAGIDTSDGLCHALQDLVNANPQCGFVVDRHSSLFDPESAALLARLHLPRELLLFGSTGEYELIFAVPKEHTTRLLSDMRAVGNELVRVGEVVEHPGLWFSSHSGSVRVDWSNMPDPREHDSNEYLARLTERVVLLLDELEG
jgi:thiamine-monophosphate kinase